MTKQKTNIADELAGLQDDEFNLDGYLNKHDYPGIGFNSTEPALYKGGEQLDPPELKNVVILALRQCKEVEGPDGRIHRYPIRTRRTEMIPGDVEARVQVAMLLDGEINVFGARSYTGRATFLNPLGGTYHDQRLPVGIWVRLIEKIKAIKAEHGKMTPPYAWEFDLKVSSEKVKMESAANAKQSTNVYPLVMAGDDFRFVGKDATNANHKLFLDEDLDGWRSEWDKMSAQAAPEPEFEEPEPEFEEEEIPF